MRLLLVTTVLAAGGGSALAAADPAETWEQIRTARLQTGRAVVVHDLEVDLTMARLRLEKGILVPAEPVGGGTAEVVFIGEGRFLMDPPDPMEAAQLELFTEQASLDVSVQRVVLVLGDRGVSASLLEREPAGELEPRIAEEATALFAEWVRGAERRGFGADAAILGAVLGDADAGAFFACWARSEDLGDFYYLFDPTELEQVTLGQFVAVEADQLEEHRIRRRIQRSQRQGRYRQLRFEDLGDWDTWVSAPLEVRDGGVVPGSTGFEPERYTLDVTIRPQDETLTGTARLDLATTRSGKRLLSLALYSDLAVRAVKDGGNRDLAWFRSGREGSEVVVVLPEATRRGEPLRVVVDYSGKALAELVKGTTYALVDTYGWYPRAGDVDRGRYDVTLRWPKGHELLASGRVVESGEEGGMRWERRALDLPALAFSFEIGAYDLHTEAVGHVALTVGFAKAGGSLDRGVQEEVLATLRSAIPFFEETFGPYPLDHLTVATVPRGFSQGFLGFITLSHSLLGLPGGSWVVIDSSFEDFSQYRQENRAETVAHELSHQWWGNKVGWRSYRDQWLSEALANYSASMFVAHGAERKSVYLARRGRSWHRSLDRGTKTGRTLESLGPVVMGTRLNSSAGSAYTAVVYDKGSVIFAMLAQLVGEESLAGMLKVLADRADHRAIDTDTFVRAVEKMSGLNLETFARQFIHGTGIPEIYYSFEFQPQEDGAWLIRGEARQVSAAHFKYRLAKTGSGAWSVSRRRDEQARVPASAFIVPFQVALAEAKGAVTKGHPRGAKTTTEKGLGGKLLIKDEVSEFSVRIPKEPRDFWLDQRGEVLATFFCENHQPKRVLRHRADELAAAGRLEEAEPLYRRALGAPLVPESDLDDTSLSSKEIARQSGLEDCLIRLGLAGLYLEMERDAEARVELETAEAALRGPEGDYYRSLRQEIHCHLDIRAGDYARAYDVLGKWLRLEFPVLEGESAVDAARRTRFKTGRRRWGDGRDYAMLAVSAFETGHKEVALVAAREAKERGADTSALSLE